MKNHSIKFHTGIHVSDVGKSVKFYSDLLRAQPVKVKSDYAKFENENLVLSLIQSPDKVQPGFGHFGLRVEDMKTLGEYRQAMAASGHTLVDEENVDCCYAVQNKFWANDPDGYMWEVYQFLEDSKGSMLAHAETSAETAESACCSPSCCQ